MHNEALARLQRYLSEARVRATPIVVDGNREDRYAVISRSSADADLVFLGTRPPRDGQNAEEYSEYYRKLLSATETLPATAMEMAGETFEFDQIFATDSERT